MRKEERAALIERLEVELDKQINSVVRTFQNLSEEDLNRQGENGGWSIAQNLKHLNLYFEYYIPAIRRSLQNAIEDPGATIFHSGWLGNYFTRSMDYRTSKKIKAFKDYIPEENLNAGKVIREFIQNEEDLLHLLRQSRKFNLTKIRLPISLTKWITMRLGDVFQFVIMHNERHLIQAESRFK